MMLTVGSLCTGYGGLELGLAELTDVRLVWVADNDPAAAKVLAHHYPHVINLGDLTAVDWSAAGQVLRVDAITAGWPCQPWSLAGKREGAKDERAIWPAVADAVRGVRPRLVFLENVPSIAAAGELARACGDLASAGYVGAWDSVRAADVGAPHRRERLFIVGARADPDGEAGPVGDRPEAAASGDRSRIVDGAATDPGRSGPQGRFGAERPDPGGRDDGPADRDATAQRGGAAPDPAGQGRRRTGAVVDDGGSPIRVGSTEPGRRGGVAADSPGDRRHEGRTEPTRVQRGPDAPVGGDDVACRACAHGFEFHDGDGFCIHCPNGCYWGADVGVVPNPDGDPIRAQQIAFARGRGPAVADTDGQVAPDADRDGRQGGEERDGEPVEPGLEAPSGDDAERRVLDWAGYGPAIERWERELGRPAPVPTVLGRRGGPQLNPRFVEWLMGLPAGYVTDVLGLSRNQMLRLLGNGVVPRQAAYAFGSLIALLESGVAA